MAYSDTPTYLNSFANFESYLQHVNPQSFDLERVRRLLRALGDPQKSLRFIHVAGTKGKGSTCALIAYILRAAGYRVGLYTSPHFYRINERIRILAPSDKDIKDDFGGSISDGELNVLVRTFRSSIERVRDDKKFGSLTYFEVLTGLALCHFARQKTDIVVLETGLGGRLDATNAVDALVSVITPISLDHTQLLGKTLKKIAAEKAAIIKNSKNVVVIGPQPREAMKVLQDRCRKFKVRPLITTNLKHRNFKMQLLGQHQIQNAAIAVGVVESLKKFGFNVPSRAVTQGIRETRWPGRFEIVHKKPTVVVDCAHNPASAKVLVKTFQQLFPGKKAVLIAGFSQDKDIVGIGRVLRKIARLVILTRSRHPRAFDFKKVGSRKIFQNTKTLYCASVKESLTLALEHAGRQDVILAAGSVFIAAEIRVQGKNKCKKIS